VQEGESPASLPALRPLWANPARCLPEAKPLDYAHDRLLAGGILSPKRSPLCPPLAPLST